MPAVHPDPDAEKQPAPQPEPEPAQRPWSAALGHALEQELSALKLGQLRRRAVAEGLSEAAVDAALDQADPKAAVLGLVLDHAATAPVLRQVRCTLAVLT